MKARRLVLIPLAVAGGLGLAAYGAFLWYTNSVERPVYASIDKDGDFEVRDYPALTMAEVTRTGDRRSAVSQGFRPLANYIFAKEREGEKIAMTAPVTQTPEESARSWSIRFIMPAGRSLDSLPKPAGTDVRLVESSPQRRAAIRFSGVATDELIAENEAKLRAWLGERGLEILGPPTYAYYNDPFTPGFMRRNEVLFDVPNG